MAGQINIAGTSGSVQLFGNDTIVTDINIYFPPAGGLLFANGNALEATDATFSGNVKIGGTSAVPATQINSLGFAYFKNSTGGSYTWINYSGGTGTGLKISDTDDYANAKTQINADGSITAAGGQTTIHSDGYIETERNNSQGILPAFKVTGKTNSNTQGTLAFACNAEFKLYDSSDNENITLRAADGSITAVGAVSFGWDKTGSQSVIKVEDSATEGRTVDIKKDGTASFIGGKCILGTSATGGYKFAGMGSGTGQTVKYNTSTGVLGYDSSSARYKDNIRDYDDIGLEKVMQLRPVKFEHKVDGKTDIGFVAEEMAEVIPELVFNDESGKPEGVAYDRICAVLTKALQESVTRIEELETKVAALES